MLEDHVGELPEQVVQDHHGARPGQRPRVALPGLGPHDVIGMTGRRAPPGSHPDAGEPPRRRSLQEVDRGLVVGGADRQEHVAGPAQQPQGGADVEDLAVQVHGGQRPFAHHDRMDEFHRHVVAVGGPLVGDAPHRRPAREPASQRQGRDGQVLGQATIHTGIEARRRHGTHHVPGRSVALARPP